MKLCNVINVRLLLSAGSIFFNTRVCKENSNCWISVDWLADVMQDGGGSRQVTSPSSKGSFYVADYKVVLVIARPPQKHSTLERIDQLSRHEIACKYDLIMFFFLNSKVFVSHRKTENNVKYTRVFQESRFLSTRIDVDEMKSRALNCIGYASCTSNINCATINKSRRYS